MKRLKTLIAGAVLALPFAATQAFADLADILEEGVIQIAIPESFAPFGAAGRIGGL